jgi:dipeptidyl-peptidase 4
LRALWKIAGSRSVNRANPTHLYDSTGHLKNHITSGEYMTGTILAIDDKARVIYFTANGREVGEDPYYTHLYRVNLDGSGWKLLTPGNFDGTLSASDSGKYFIDTFSRVDTAPKSALYPRWICCDGLSL